MQFGLRPSSWSLASAGSGYLPEIGPINSWAVSADSKSAQGRPYSCPLLTSWLAVFELLLLYCGINSWHVCIPGKALDHLGVTHGSPVLPEKRKRPSRHYEIIFRVDGPPPFGPSEPGVGANTHRFLRFEKRGDMARVVGVLDSMEL